MTIVFATDGSDHAKAAEEVIRRLPLSAECKVLCVSVFSPSFITSSAGAHPFVGGVLAAQIEAAIDEERRQAEEASQGAAARLKAAGLSAEAETAEGDPVTEVINRALDQGAQLIVCGARGKSSIEDLLLGSVARGLANESPVSVIVTRGKALSEGAGLSSAFATDFGDLHGEFVKKLAKFFPARLRSLAAVVVVDPDSKETLALARQLGSDLGQARDREEIERIVQGALEETAENLAGAAESVTTRVLFGDVRKELMTLSSEPGLDLLILGARSRSAVSRLLLGSVSHQMAIRASCSVLILRP